MDKEQVNILIDQAINAMDPLGIGINCIAYVALIVALIALILVAAALLKAYLDNDTLKQNVRMIRELKMKIGEQEQKIARLSGHVEAVGMRQYQAEQVRPAAPEPRPAAIPQQPLRQESPEEQLRNRLNSFVQEYNALMSQRNNSMAARDAKRQFVQDNRLRGFDCVNYEARMNHPEQAPIFAENGNPAQAYFWALQLQGDQYAVVPNLKAYEGQVHQTGGMKEVFDSNYQAGSYAGIMVLKPAIFSGLSQLLQKGQLRLEK